MTETVRRTICTIGVATRREGGRRREGTATELDDDRPRNERADEMSPIESSESDSSLTIERVDMRWARGEGRCRWKATESREYRAASRQSKGVEWRRRASKGVDRIEGRRQNRRALGNSEGAEGVEGVEGVKGVKGVEGVEGVGSVEEGAIGRGGEKAREKVLRTLSAT
jgi:hypothetical protein